MKITTTIAALSLFSAISFGASAAQLVNSQQAENLQSAGTITLSGVAGTPSDIRQQLSQKADREGASAYRIIEARNQDSWHATAEIYK
ncbi:peroxide/acid stress response protein YhcN [Erwinia sorbitola]|uniref:Peroxide/acid stress response protein YhcN n=1 Tax=Erwinia sorbitola TaxID=2681984 RepID=A0A6I6E8J2_9GAMM|nr:peroxide/acid stress response protein YhcN [Erwinia sorbitola]MTD27912.1 peroxide/acid stress response protein YhcN [Erwinia sorbitola]QGU86107.1 peroxide/acid stress response protein YhcN [Erwinia sorbitola]